jgi:AcrR family transcriptional regulator
MNSKDFKTIHLPGPEPEMPPRAKRADAVANRELILATAQRLFAEDGLSDVCMSAIAEAAEVGKGTLYRAFANKGELCLALMDEDMRLFQNRTLQMLREKYDQPALSRLDSFLDNLVHFMEFHAPLMREVQLHGIYQQDTEAEQTSPHMWLPWLRDTIGILLQQAEQQREASDLDIPYLVDAMLAPLAADLFIYQREVLGFDLARISRGLRRLVLAGCRTGRASAQSVPKRRNSSAH